MSYKALLHNYESALARQSWEQVSPCFAEDAVVVFSEGTYFGRSQIEAAFRRTFDLIKDETFKIENVVWVYVQSACALCTYTFKWSGLIDGKAQSGGGRGTSLLVLEGNTWKIKHEHLGPEAGHPIK